MCDIWRRDRRETYLQAGCTKDRQGLSAPVANDREVWFKRLLGVVQSFQFTAESRIAFASEQQLHFVAIF